MEENESSAEEKPDQFDFSANSYSLEELANDQLQKNPSITGADFIYRLTGNQQAGTGLSTDNSKMYVSIKVEMMSCFPYPVTMIYIRDVSE